ncbi:MAG: TatD family hydrolase [Patescibacteria group bacterium]|jgi:TatD DNase family protein
MSLNLIDTHAHLDFEEFSEDREEVIKRAFAVGVNKIINIGCDEIHFKSTLEIASGQDNIYAVIGLHPHEAMTFSRDQKEQNEELKRVIKRLDDFTGYKKLVGIGEIGLDFFHIAREKEREQSSIYNLQKNLFVAQLEFALKANLPIVIHCREAYDEVLEILKKYSANKNLRGVIHSFEGSFDVASEFIKLGFLVSFNGMLTYEKSDEQLSAASRLPIDKILLETDCPYLTPVPLRGQRNEPSYIEYTAKKLAELRNTTIEEVAEQTTANAVNFFKLS